MRWRQRADIEEIRTAAATRIEEEILPVRILVDGSCAKTNQNNSRVELVRLD